MSVVPLETVFRLPGDRLDGSEVDDRPLWIGLHVGDGLPDDPTTARYGCATASWSPPRSQRRRTPAHRSRPGVLMFVALVLFAALGDSVVRLLEPVSAQLQVSGRVDRRARSAGPGATAL
jgi:hypothetical protein